MKHEGKDVFAMRWVRWLDVAAFLVFSGLLAAHWQWSARYLVGLCLAASGFSLWMVARFQLGQSFSTGAQAKRLVTTGLYARFQHPIYLFGEVAYVGLAIAWGHWLGYLYLLLTAPRACAYGQCGGLGAPAGTVLERFSAKQWWMSSGLYRLRVAAVTSSSRICLNSKRTVPSSATCPAK